MSSEQISLHLKRYYGSSFPYYDKIVMITPFLKQIETHQKTSLTYINPVTIRQATTTAVQPPSSFDPASEYEQLTDPQQATFLPSMSSSQPPPLIFQQGCMWPGPTTSDSSTLLLKSTEFPPELETYALGQNYKSHPSLLHNSSLYIPSSSSQIHPTIQAPFDLSWHPSSRASPISGSPLSQSLRSHPYLEQSSRYSSRWSSLLHEVARDTNPPNSSLMQVDHELVVIGKISKALEAMPISSEEKAKLLDYFCDNPKRAAATPEEETFRQAYFLTCLEKISSPNR